MPAVVSADEANKVIRVILHGVMDMAVVKQSVEDASEYYTQGYTKALIDVTEQELNPSTMDTYDLAISLLNKVPKLKQALFISKDSTSETRFLETVLLNRGGMMRIFWSEEKAIEWLMDDATLW